jgi:HEAT repeat protein
LKQVQQKNGKIVAEKIDTPVTDLLTLLESNAAADLKPIQDAVIESIRSEQRDELIGQIDRLEKLLKSPDAQVRAIAVWSLARSDDLSKAPLLIERIRKDPDYDVAREANRGLCVLSRRLTGVGYNDDPIAALKDEQDTKKIEERILQWRASASKAWQDWYLKVRAYRERDDLLDLKK